MPIRVARKHLQILASIALAWHALAVVVIPLTRCCCDDLVTTLSSMMDGSTMGKASAAPNCPMHGVHEQGTAATRLTHEVDGIPSDERPMVVVRCADTSTDFTAPFDQAGVLPATAANHLLLEASGPVGDQAFSMVSLAPVPLSPPPRA